MTDKELKITNLMVGDWVIFHESSKVSRKCIVRSIDKDSNLIVEWIDDDDIYSELTQDISPIPLTTEILEKNGFKKFNFRGIDGQHEWTWWNNTLTNVSLWCRELNDNTKDGWMIRIESPTSSLCVKVEFLHELQHALRICGIEKEIEL